MDDSMEMSAGNAGVMSRFSARDSGSINRRKTKQVSFTESPAVSHILNSPVAARTATHANRGLRCQG